MMVIQAPKNHDGILAVVKTAMAVFTPKTHEGILYV
jgi:hypothetical protein